MAATALFIIIVLRLEIPNDGHFVDRSNDVKIIIIQRRFFAFF